MSSHVGIFRCGPDAWNAWRLKHPSAIPNLTGLALGQSDRQLGPALGGPINLRLALLRDAVLRFANLADANLAAADLSGADLAHARLDRASLKGADLGKSGLDYANLEQANLSKSSLLDASLRFARLSEATLEGADLSGADLSHARLDQANLKSAKLSGARLDYADFGGANLTKVDLKGANLQGARNLTAAQLEKSVGDDSTILPADLRGSVSWSRGVGENEIAAFVYRESQHAPQRFAKTSDVSSPSFGLILLIAVSATTATLAVTAGWQYRPPLNTLFALLDEATGKLARSTRLFGVRVPLPSASDAPQALKPSEVAVANKLKMDAPKSILLSRQSALGQLSPALVVPPTLLIASAPVPSTRIGMTGFRQILVEDQVFGTDATRRLAELHALNSAGMSPAPVPAPRKVTPARTSSHAVPLRPLSAPLLTTVVDVPAIHPLAPTVLLSSDARQSPVMSALPFIAKRRDVLAALAPSGKITPPSIRVQAPSRRNTIQKSIARTRGDPLILSVSLDQQVIDVFRGTSLVMSSRVSSGMPGHETKPGVFSILEKQRFHHSNIYSGAPMPWMQRLTRSGTALHAGMVPGYPASHGCVRLPFSFAPKLFQMTTVGETVMISSDRMTPKPIEHPKLFQPRPRPVALAMAESSPQPWRLAENQSRPIDTVILPLVSARDAETANDDAESPSADGDALEPAPLHILVTRRTPRDQLIGVQYVLSSMGYLERQNFDGTFGKSTVAAIRAFQAANGLTATGALNNDLVKKIYEVAGEPFPPEGQLFVRQDFSRVFDTPITFRQPSQPLGTHVYTALNFSPKDGRVRWVAFSLEGGDPMSVLDRLEIPEDVRRMISEALTPGSSLIVADTSVDSAILPEGDDFLVWAHDPSATESAANEPSDKETADNARPSSIKPANLRRAKVEPAKPKRSARNRAATAPRDVWSRPARRYTASPPPTFAPPRWFSPW